MHSASPITPGPVNLQARAAPGAPDVLIADDDAVTRKLLESALKSWGYAVRTSSNGEDAWEVLSGVNPPTMAILDWMMPGLDGPRLCQMLRTLPGPYVYVLLLTSRNAKSDLVRGLDAGADDYIVKPFDRDELNARLRVGQRVLRLEHELRDRAFRDPLTGIWSRRAILELLPQELDRARRDGVPLGIALADLDHFKRVNDEYGHLVGDAVLTESARRFKSVLRPYDQIGRFGGEEILFLLPKCNQESASAVAERVRLSLCEAPIETESARLQVSVSIGLCVAEPDDPSAPNAFLHQADVAMYRAKSCGRNRVEVHPAGPTR